jgi:hypothetical protein
VVLLPDATIAVGMQRRCATTDDRLTEIDTETEKRGQTGEQREHGYRSSHPLRFQFAELVHI